MDATRDVRVIFRPERKRASVSREDIELITLQITCKSFFVGAISGALEGFAFASHGSSSSTASDFTATKSSAIKPF
jgi:hypothetical protein